MYKTKVILYKEMLYGFIILESLFVIKPQGQYLKLLDKRLFGYYEI